MYVDEEVIEARESEQPMPFDQLEQKERDRIPVADFGTLPPRQQEVINLNSKTISVTNRSRRHADNRQ